MPKVISIVGKGGSGKTTLLERVLPVLAARGLVIGVVKHDAHDHETDTPGKDTYRLRQAGAAVTALVSPRRVTSIETFSEEPSLDDVVREHFAGMDLVLTEGYKSGPAPKIEVVRRDRSSEPICGPEELLLLVTDVDLDVGVPRVGLDDVEAVARTILEWMGPDQS
jgi:molybdopterin-guanine dinucleotide biosynthesis protein B